jgi:uncharacterized protein
MRRLICCLVFLWLPAHASDITYKEWLAFKEAFAVEAGGPTGMYAIQDMLEVAAGEAAYLPLQKSDDAIRWSKQPAAGPTVKLAYDGKQAMLSGPGVPPIDLLEAKDRRRDLPNGLIVRVTFLRDKSALKAWLYNPKLPAQRNFKGLAYFPYDASGVVTGAFRRNDQPTAVTFMDSRNHAGTMYVVGTWSPQISGKRYDLKLFSYEQNWSNIDAMLLLLRDRTSGKTTYGGGRVVEVSIPKGAPPAQLTINLNMAYSFLCAHSDYYNCPLVLANVVDTELRYGEKHPPL